MQAPTHLAIGILVEKAMERVESPRLRKSSVALVAALFHPILDALSDLTYHPPEPVLADPFWVSYHLFLSVLTICILLRYWGKYKFGMLFSILPDFDWFVIHLVRVFKPEIPLCEVPVFHKLLSGLARRFVPFRSPKSLPNWRLVRRGVLVEFAVWASLASLYCAIGRANGTSFSVQERRENRV
jgi:hypothetical protein